MHGSFQLELAFLRDSSGWVGVDNSGWVQGGAVAVSKLMAACSSCGS